VTINATRREKKETLESLLERCKIGNYAQYSKSQLTEVRHTEVAAWRQWPYAALFCAGFLGVLAPLVFGYAGTPLGLLYLQLPIYMLHQYEEHAGDRFRLWVNNTLGHGRDVLTPIATSGLTRCWCGCSISSHFTWRASSIFRWD